MRTGEPILEKSRSVGDLQHTRLMALLRRVGAGQGTQGGGAGAGHRPQDADRESGKRQAVQAGSKRVGEGAAVGRRLARSRAAGAQRQAGRAGGEGRGPCRGAEQGHPQGSRSRPGRGQGAQERARPGDTAVGTAGWRRWKWAGAFRARRRRSAQSGSRRGGPRSGGSTPSWRPASLPTTTRGCSVRRGR